MINPNHIDFEGISSVCTPIIIAVFSFMTPLIIQVVSQIDTKYHSVSLIRRFKREREYRFLLTSLAVSIALLIYNYLFSFPWNGSSNHSLFNIVMSNSSSILLLITTVCLIIVIFFTIHILLIYLDYKKLFDHIYKNTNRKKKLRKTKGSEAEDIRNMAELASYAAGKSDYGYILKLEEFLWQNIKREQLNEANDISHKIINSILVVNGALLHV